MTLNFRVKSHIFNILEESKIFFFLSSNDHQKTIFCSIFLNFYSSNHSNIFYACFYHFFKFSFLVLLFFFQTFVDGLNFSFVVCFDLLICEKSFIFYFLFFQFFFCFFQIFDNCLSSFFVSVLIRRFAKDF